MEEELKESSLVRLLASANDGVGAILVSDEHTLELLLLSSVPLTEAEWGQATSLESFLHVQTQELITDPEQGAACADRFIRKRLEAFRRSRYSQNNGEGANAQQQSAWRMMMGDDDDGAAMLTREGFFDAYAAVSGGLMHHLDERPWRMGRSAMERLRAAEHATDMRLRTAKFQRLALERMMAQCQAMLDTSRVLLDFMPSPLLGASTMVEEDEVDETAIEQHAAQAHVRWVLEHHALELETMEARELDMIQKIEEDHIRLTHIRCVLERQSQIRTLWPERAATRFAIRILGQQQTTYDNDTTTYIQNNSNNDNNSEDAYRRHARKRMRRSSSPPRAAAAAAAAAVIVLDE